MYRQKEHNHHLKEFIDDKTITSRMYHLRTKMKSRNNQSKPTVCKKEKKKEDQ